MSGPRCSSSATSGSCTISRATIPKAPWETGTVYPVEWAADGDTDPRTSFEEASMIAELPPAELHRNWPFPTDNDGEAGLPNAAEVVAALAWWYGDAS